MTKEERDILLDAEVKNIKKQFPAEVIDEIFSQEGQKDYDYVGYMNLYRMLSTQIKPNMIIIDIGCYLAAHCYLFKDYIKYIGVDDCKLKRFSCDNTEHYCGDVRDFLNDYKFDDMTEEERSQYFVICAYDINIFIQNRINNTFPNVITCYPN